LRLLEAADDRRGVADTLDLLGMTSAFVDSEQSAAYYDRAIPLLREFDDCQGLVTDLVMRALEGGFYWGDTFAPARLDAVRSERDAEEAVRLARSIDWRAGESFALWELALWYGIRGSYRRAFELALTGLRIAEEIEHRQWIAAGLCSVGALYVDLLAADRARPLLERALALARELGSSVWTPYAASRLGMAYTQQRDFSRAAATLDGELNAETPFESAPQRQLWCARAELCMARGAAGDALAIADKLVTTLPPDRVAPRVWIVRGEALSAIGSTHDAERTLSEAIEASRVSDLRSLLWRAEAVLGRLLRTRGRRDEAERHVQSALAHVEELGVELAEETLRQAFLKRAVTHIPPRGLVSERRLNKRAFDGLTAREREVAALIAGGLSNRAIADKLVVSERTVESYVSSMLGKLGASARTQIAAWAVTKGIASEA
jgi:DNA-binding CsgD family transcriptional regulator/tetratricopeptide (TPR) repeat protein